MADKNDTSGDAIFLAHDDDTVVVIPVARGTAAVYSKPAPNREGSNEDGAAVLTYDADTAVLVVVDGVGGGPVGDRAARITVGGIQQALEHADKATELRTVVLNGIEAANTAVQELTKAAACTVAVVGLQNEVARPFHVGDSMILIVGQRGVIKHQTIPHGPVGYGVEAGLLDETEAMSHEERNVVSNVVGDKEMRIEVGPSVELAARDTVLLATDGVFDNAYVDEVVEIIRKGPLKLAARELADLCRRRMIEPKQGEPSKQDDLTFVVYRQAD